MPESEPVTYIESVLRRVRTSESGDEFVFYFGTITSDIAKDITFVPAYLDPYHQFPEVLNVRFDDGYQRAGVVKRMNDFSMFLDQHPLSIIPPIMLSTRGEWHFVPYDESENYGRLEVHDQGAILDGQHRLGGYVLKYQSDGNSMDIDFIALGGMSLQQEREEFTELNRNQNRVSPSLLATLEADAATNPNAWVALQLDERTDSPFNTKIAHEKIGPDQLFNMAAVTKNVRRMFTNGCFRDTPPEVKIEIAIQYWDVIMDLHPNEWSDIDVRPRSKMVNKLLETTGLIAWSLAAGQILSRYFDPVTSTVNWDGVEALISSTVGEIDWRKTGPSDDRARFQGLTGEVGGDHIKRGIELCIAGYDGVTTDEVEDYN